jgi:hypothetical protein
MGLRPAWIQTSLIRIHAVRLPTLLQVEKLIANSMDPDLRLRGCADWSGSMLVANALRWFCRYAAHIIYWIAPVLFLVFVASLHLISTACFFFSLRETINKQQL